MQLTSEEITRFLELQLTIARAITKPLEAALHEVHGLDLRAASTLHSIDHGCLYPSDVSEVLHMPSAMTSRALDPLVKQGLVERRLDPNDGRRIQLHLTEAGHQAAADLNDLMRRQVGELLEHLTPETRHALLTALQTLASHTTEREAAAK